ncbi:zf-DHHC-domain-containing protein [Phellopilus nigrolimitatus]|nr:zf-DHHC-domain-containing protein [Phellopilus nigrolimitatus]
MTTSNDAVVAPKPDEKRKRRFMGFADHAAIKRQERARRNKPRPWIERKFIVAVVVGIAGYAWYVYVGRFCVPMIRRDVGAMGGRGMGVAFLVVFCLLGLMFWWTYIKLILTSPGYAKDFVSKTPAPQSNTRPTRARSTPSASRMHDHDSDDSDEWDSSDEDIGGMPYSEISPGAESSYDERRASIKKDSGIHVGASPLPRPPAPAAYAASSSRRKSSTNSGQKQSNQLLHKTSDNQDMNAGELDAVPPVANVNAAARDPYSFSNPKLTPLPPKTLPNPDANQPGGSGQRIDDGLPPPMNSRRPPLHPVLLPEYRYCFKDGFVKPMRAHHCRTCATCVLMYDHHCPWIGQCVGAHNHKFFVNFLQWSSPWTLWTFATLVALNARKDSDPGFNIDPEQIVIIALSAIFSLFTVVLLAAHIQLIIVNQSSVESLYIHGMKDRERATLGRMLPMWSWRANAYRKRNQIRREWDTEWGKLGTEGNIWWLENARTNWEHRMGKSPWGWFLPVGRSEGDGLTYPTNPRFDVDGRWRRRSEWPPELR